MICIHHSGFNWWASGWNLAWGFLLCSKCESRSIKELYRWQTCRFKSGFQKPHQSQWPSCSLSLSSVFSPWEFSTVFSLNRATGKKGRDGLRIWVGCRTPHPRVCCNDFGEKQVKLPYREPVKRESEQEAPGFCHPTRPRGCVWSFWPGRPCTWRMLQPGLAVCIFSSRLVALRPHLTWGPVAKGGSEPHIWYIAVWERTGGVPVLLYGGSLCLQSDFSTKEYL